MSLGSTHLCSKSTISQEVFDKTPLRLCVSVLRSIFTVWVYIHHSERWPIGSNVSIVPRHMLSSVSVVFSHPGLECEHLSASCSLSESVYLQTSCMVEKSNPVVWDRVWFRSKTLLKPTPYGKARIFLSDRSTERMSTPGMAISWILQQLSHAFNLFGIDEPTRQNLAEIQTCWFWLEGFWASTTEGSIF